MQFIGRRILGRPLTMLLGCLVLITLLSKCHITYIVRLSGTDLYGKMQVPCGYGKVFLRGRGKRHFAFWQVFRLKEKSRYHSDNIHAWFNGISLPVETINRTHKTKPKGHAFNVYDGDTIITRFFIPEGVFEEDTIIVKTSGLLECKDKTAGEDQFYYYFNRNEFIRIR